MSLGDLDELILSCRNEDGRKYIAEAVRCYKAGAYRALHLWFDMVIAVVYDLLSKGERVGRCQVTPKRSVVVADLNRVAAANYPQ